MSGKEKVSPSSRKQAGRRTDPHQQSPAGGPRHMKASGPGPHQWAAHRLASIAGRLDERWLRRRPSPSTN
ncbi:hypothetical protein ACLH0K_01095 [Arthrobacter sp. MPF02]|uniref:hypothetical protein n=1 Tax=Arthrobacter sp. MPF02 TaxID=3388492 RepID=UPI00398549C5